MWPTRTSNVVPGVAIWAGSILVGSPLAPPSPRIEMVEITTADIIIRRVLLASSSRLVGAVILCKSSVVGQGHFQLVQDIVVVAELRRCRLRHPGGGPAPLILDEDVEEVSPRRIIPRKGVESAGPLLPQVHRFILLHVRWQLIDFLT